LDDPALADYRTDAYANVLADIVKSLDPVIITGASVQGRIWLHAGRPGSMRG
jgi:hypothetical protein